MNIIFILLLAVSSPMGDKANISSVDRTTFNQDVLDGFEGARHYKAVLFKTQVALTAYLEKYDCSGSYVVNITNGKRWKISQIATSKPVTKQVFDKFQVTLTEE